ncbi:MAG TPA: c-type cytochrome, partial [Prosthecobacter sp.]|nr:c-type cytochrome [Prosthecobacter sp.]
VDMARGIVQHKFFLTHYLIANIEARKLEQPVNLGRIWRIVPDGKGAPKAKAVKLPAETAAIVPLLDHPNGHVRDTAQRVLMESADAGVTDAVKKLTVEGTTAQGRVQALWTLEGLGPVMPDVISPCLKDPNEKVRATAVRLAGLGNLPEMMAMQEDPSAEVRVQLALQLSAQSSPEAQAVVLKILKKGGSPLLNDAIASGGRGHELEYLEELLKEPAGKEDVLAKSGLLKMLAGCVMNERRSARVAKLLELTAAQKPDSPRQMALVQGIVGIPSEAKAKPQIRKRLYLDAQPPALEALNTKANSLMKNRVLISDGTKKSYMELLDAAIAWPNQPGVPPAPVVKPLTAEQQARFEKGKLIYSGLCAACHQPSGLGLEGLAPPLVDSDWVTGPADRGMRIILHGLSGPINVGGRTWRLEMPPLPHLTDDDIAAILTYTRREWEHGASPVAPEDVAKVRAAHAGRTKAWTAEELNPVKKK